MQMYLQFGFGMMAHTRALLDAWGSGGVILSPRDLNQGQLERMAAEARSAGGEPLLDPQCYARDADHHRLTAHRYWGAITSHSTGAFTGGPGTASLLSELAAVAGAMGVRRHILPGCLAPSVDADWFLMQESILDEAPRHFGDQPLLLTVALSADAMSSEEQVEAVVERSRTWPVAGIYVVPETPSAYLADQPSWLANLLLLTSGLKLNGKEVIVGYCNHQMLCLAAANVDVIASGTWLNVRAFPPDKFYEPEEASTSRRAVWYYCPQALSEYKVPFLDIAHRTGVLDNMRSDPSLGSAYADPLFTGAVPSSVNWSETDAFRHYLTCLHSQVGAARCSTFDETVTAHQNMLNSAERLLRSLRRAGVMGQDRDFTERVDVNRSAIALFAAARGGRLSRAW